jgi:hypothetical protein
MLDSARWAAARRVVEDNGGADSIVAAVRAQLPALRAANPQVSPEFWTRFETLVAAGARQVQDSIVLLYARAFSQQELEELATFNRSPLGQHLWDAMPTLITETIGIVQRWTERIAAQLRVSPRGR